MTYRVTKQYGRGADIFCQDFKNLKDAQAFIAENLDNDIKMNVAIIYKIAEFGEVIKTYDAKNYAEIADLNTSAQAESGAGGKGSGASFQPTPFSTTAKPKGAPQNWVKDEDDKDKE